MNRSAFAALATLMVACSGDTTKTDSETTETGHTGSTGCETTYSGPVLVDTAEVSCSGTDVTIDVQTMGWTSSGRLHQRDNGDTPYWSDNHPIASYAFDECGAYDKLDVTLTTGATTAAWQEGTSTVFTCDGHYTQNVMSYGVAVWDFDGAFADCMVWGRDPAEIVSNPDGDVGEPVDWSGDSTELQGWLDACAVGSR